MGVQLPYRATTCVNSVGRALFRTGQRVPNRERGGGRGGALDCGPAWDETALCHPGGTVQKRRRDGAAVPSQLPVT